MIKGLLKIQQSLLLITLGVSMLSANTAQKGWEALYNNKPLVAQKRFKEAIAKGTAEEKAKAYRGLAVVADFTGNEKEIIHNLVASYNHDKDIVSLAANTIHFYEWSTLNRGTKDKAVYKTLKEIHKTNTLFAGLFQDAYIYRFLNDGNIGKAKAIKKQMGIIDNWQFIGPFDNISNAGFNKVYAPEKEIVFTKIYSGKDGNKTAWSPIQNNSPFGWIFLKNHSKAFNAVHYFYTTIESPVERDAMISLGASGSHKLFLNGKEVLRDSLFRNTGIDAFMHKVKLNKGSNALLVKIGHENEGRRSANVKSNFMVRVLDTDFKALTDLTFNATKAVNTTIDPQSHGKLSTTLLDSVKSVLINRMKKDPNDLDAFTSLVNMVTFLEMGQDAELLLKEKIQEYPNSSLLHGLYAEASLRSKKRTEFEVAIKKAHKESPLNWRAWEYTLTETIEEGNPERMLAFLDSAPEIFKDNPIVITTYILVYSSQSRKSEVLRMISKLETLQEKTPEAVALLAQYYISSGQTTKGMGMLKNLLMKNRMGEELYSEVASNQMQQGNISEAINTYRLLEEQLPLSPQPNLFISLIYMNQNNLQSALTEIEKAIKKSPFNATILNMKANILASLGKKEEAISIFESIVDYTNSDFIAYESIRDIKNQKSFSDMTPLPNIDSLIRASNEWRSEKNRSAILSYITDIYYYPSHATRSRKFMILQLHDQESIDEWKEQRIGFNPAYQTFNIDKAYTRKADGTEIKADQSRNHLVYKSLEPGDFLILEYSLFDYYQGAMAGKTYGTTYFSPTLPAYSMQLRMVTPKEDTIPYVVHGEHIRNDITILDSYAVRTFSISGKNTTDPKRFAPSDFKTNPKVVYSNFKDWGEIASWYSELSAQKQQETTQIRAVADSLFKDISDPRKKVEKVYDYIFKNITYSSVSFRQSGWVPQRAQDVLMTKIGDCKDMSSLGKALLNIGGVESYLVLENSESRYFTDHNYIGPNFNHCILGYKVTDSLEYIDFTNKYTPFGAIPKYIQGTMALVIDDTSKNVIQLPMDSPENRIKKRDVKVILNNDRSIESTVHTERSGSFADDFRYFYRFTSKSEQKESMREVLSKTYADLELLDFSLSDLATSEHTISYDYSFKANNAFAISGNTAIFTVDTPDEIRAGSFPTDTTRVLPIDMGYRKIAIGTFVSSTAVEAPKNWKLMSLPKDVTLKTDNIEYRLQFKKIDKNQITIERTVKTNYNRLFSSKEFKDDIVALKKAAQSDKIQLLFTIQ